MWRNKYLYLSLLLAFFIIFPSLSQAENLTWQQSGANGLGEDDNSTFYGFYEYGDYLYTGSVNLADGAELWRGSAWDNWEQVNDDGFGDANNAAIYDFAEFKGALYTGTYNLNDGGAVYKSTDGEIWNLIDNGFGDANNIGVFKLVAWGDYLYAGTWNLATGAELWRSPDGTNWTQMDEDGFGDATNLFVSDVAVLGDYLYLGLYDLNDGSELWRSVDGETWEMINNDGFGDDDNTSLYGFVEYNNTYYLGTSYINDAAQIWSSTDGETWTQADGLVLTEAQDIVRDLIVSNGNMYASIDDDDNGMQIYRMDTNEDWVAVSSAGFGDVLNTAAMNLAEFDGYLVVPTRQVGGLAEIWYTDVEAPSTTVVPEAGDNTTEINVSLHAVDNHGANLTTYYTIDDTTPTTASDVYSTMLTVSLDTTLQYFSVDANGNTETVQSAVYQFYPKKIYNTRANKVKERTATIRWNTQDFADKYYVQLRKRKGKKIKTFKKNITTNKKKIKKKWMKSGKKYKVRVRGVADNGLKGEWSKYKNFKTK